MNKEFRKTGKSTKIINRCINELFTNGKTYLYDHSRLTRETDNLMNKFSSRMNAEHKKTKFVFKQVKESGIYCYLIEIHEL